jgi:thiol-disulfide isomerase/thioredoxin
MKLRRRTLLTFSVGAAAVAAGTAAGLYAFRDRSTDAAATPATLDKGVLRAHTAPVPVATLSFEDVAGNRRTLADFRGRHVLLNVWATWCMPCRQEMPSLERLQLKLGGPRFTVLALSVDSGGVEAVRRFYAELGLKALDIFVDRSLQVNSALRIVGLPSTVLIDGEGREVARHIGPAEWDSAPLVESIARLVRRGE